jgi:hypothetical protein
VSGYPGVPECDAVALHNGVVTVVARVHLEESLVEQALGRATQEQIAAAFGDVSVQSFRVVGVYEGVRVLGDKLAE